MAMRMNVVDPARAQKYFEDKMSFTTGPAELKYFLDQKADLNIIDVRAKEDYDEDHIPGALSLPEDKWQSLEGLKKDRVNVIYCYSQVCHLAATAAKLFAAKGFPVMELEGGYETWHEMYSGAESEEPETQSTQTKGTTETRTEAV